MNVARRGKQMDKRADQSGKMRPIRSKNMGRPVFEMERSSILVVGGRPSDFVSGVEKGVL